MCKETTEKVRVYIVPDLRSNCERPMGILVPKKDTYTLKFIKLTFVYIFVLYSEYDL